MAKTTKKIISVVTVLCFVMTQNLFASPGMGIEIVSSRETPALLQIDIPAELATLDGLYEAPLQSNPKLILHIQNAHANYGAQQKIKELLQYLEKNYAIKTLFVEGASEDLNPDYLKMFPDRERNLKLADFLAKQGELTGAELYLLEADNGQGVRSTESGAKTEVSKDNAVHRTQDAVRVKAHGIENAELYRENYEALKKVFGAEVTVKHYLDGFEGRLSTLASQIFSKELLKLLGEWKKFEKGHREFMPYVKTLAAESKRVLGVDLESLLSQIEWPQITRLLVLQTMEKELDMKKGIAERDQLIQFLKEKRVSAKLITAIENFQDQRVTVLRGNTGGPAAPVEPRDLMEQLATEAGPKGFYFYNYPNFSLYAGYLILKSEMDPKGLFDEIKVLFTRLLDQLAQTPREKQLLELCRNEELVRKLLNLELTRKDWQEVLAKKDLLAMDPLVAGLKEIGTAVSRETGLPLTKFETEDVNPKFRGEVADVQAAAYGFYDAAHRREDVFYEKIASVMEKDKLNKAVVITGGFHTDGMTELLREHEVSYGILTPRLSEKSDENLYRNVMLQNRPSLFELSYLEAALRLLPPRAYEAQIGEKEMMESLKTILRAIGYAGDFGAVDGAIEVFNRSIYAKAAGIKINPVPVTQQSGKSIYQVIRGTSTISVIPEGAESATNRSEVRGRPKPDPALLPEKGASVENAFLVWVEKDKRTAFEVREEIDRLSLTSEGISQLRFALVHEKKGDLLWTMLSGIMSFASDLHQKKIGPSARNRIVESVPEIFDLSKMAAEENARSLAQRVLARIFFGDVSLVGDLDGLGLSDPEKMTASQELIRVGIIPTPVLVEALSLLSSDAREGQRDAWMRSLLNMIQNGGFDLNDPIHAELGFTLLNWQASNIAYAEYVKNAKNVKKLRQEGKDEAEAALTIGSKADAELYYLVYEAQRLMRFIRSIDKKGRPVMVVENFSYGKLPVMPIKVALESEGVRVAQARVSSRSSDNSPYYVDTGLFSDEDLAYILKFQPVIIIVDGSSSVALKQSARPPHYPASYQGFQNYFITLNESLGGVPSPDAFHMDLLRMNEIRANYSYGRSLAELRSKMTPLAIPQPYGMDFWTEAGAPLELWDRRTDEAHRYPAPVKTSAIAGPRLIITQTGIEDSVIRERAASGEDPEAAQTLQGAKGSSHEPNFFDDKKSGEEYKDFAYRRMYWTFSAFGPEMRDAFQDVSLKRYQKLTGLVSGAKLLGERSDGERSEVREGTASIRPIDGSTSGKDITERLPWSARSWSEIGPLLLAAAKEGYLTHLYVDIDNTLTSPNGYHNSVKQISRLRRRADDGVREILTSRIAEEEKRMIVHDFYRTAGGLDVKLFETLRNTYGVRIVALTARPDVIRDQTRAMLATVGLREKETLDGILFAAFDKIIHTGDPQLKLKMIEKDFGDYSNGSERGNVVFIDDQPEVAKRVNRRFLATTIRLRAENPNNEEIAQEKYIRLAERAAGAKNEGHVFEYLVNAFDQSSEGEEGDTLAKAQELLTSGMSEHFQKWVDATREYLRANHIPKEALRVPQATAPASASDNRSEVRDDAAEVLGRLGGSPVFGSPDEWESFAGAGNETSWLSLTDHIQVEFVDRMSGQWSFVPTRSGEGSGTVYTYRLPGDLTIAEAFQWMSTIRDLPFSNGQEVLSELAVPFAKMAVWMAQRAVLQPSVPTSIGTMAGSFWVIGAALAKETLRGGIPSIEEMIAGQPSLEALEPEIFYWLGLTEEQIREFKDAFNEGRLDIIDLVLKEALQIAAEITRIEIKALTYFRGWRLYKDYLGREGGRMSGVMADIRTQITESMKKGSPEDVLQAQKAAVEKLATRISEFSGWVHARGASYLEASPERARLTDEINCVGRTALMAMYLEELQRDGLLEGVRVSSAVGPSHIQLAADFGEEKYWANPAELRNGFKRFYPMTGNAEGFRLGPLKTGIMGSFLNNLGHAFMDQNKPDAAIAAYRESIRIDPRHSSVHFSLGYALHTQGKFEAAMAACYKALENDPDNVNALRNLGILLVTYGKIDEALALYERANLIASDDAVTHREIGRALSIQDKFDAAIEEYQKSIDLDPDDAVTHRLLGRAMHARGMFEAAVEAYQISLELKPEIAETHFNLGLALQDQEKFGEAIAAFRDANRLHPNNALIHLALGSALFDQGTAGSVKDNAVIEEAIDEFFRSIDKDPGENATYDGLGRAFQALGNFAATNAAFEEANSPAPKYSAALKVARLSRSEVRGDQGIRRTAIGKDGLESMRRKLIAEKGLFSSAVNKGDFFSGPNDLRKFSFWSQILNVAALTEEEKQLIQKIFTAGFEKMKKETLAEVLTPESITPGFYDGMIEKIDDLIFVEETRNAAREDAAVSERFGSTQSTGRPSMTRGGFLKLFLKGAAVVGAAAVVGVGVKELFLDNLKSPSESVDDLDKKFDEEALNGDLDALKADAGKIQNKELRKLMLHYLDGLSFLRKSERMLYPGISEKELARRIRYMAAQMLMVTLAENRELRDYQKDGPAVGAFQVEPQTAADTERTARFAEQNHFGPVLRSFASKENWKEYASKTGEDYKGIIKFLDVIKNTRVNTLDLDPETGNLLKDKKETKAVQMAIVKDKNTQCFLFRLMYYEKTEPAAEEVMGGPWLNGEQRLKDYEEQYNTAYSPLTMVPRNEGEEAALRHGLATRLNLTAAYELARVLVGEKQTMAERLSDPNRGDLEAFYKGVTVDLIVVGNVTSPITNALRRIRDAEALSDNISREMQKPAQKRNLEKYRKSVKVNLTNLNQLDPAFRGAGNYLRQAQESLDTLAAHSSKGYTKEQWDTLKGAAVEGFTQVEIAQKRSLDRLKELSAQLPAPKTKKPSVPKFGKKRSEVREQAAEEKGISAAEQIRGIFKKSVRSATPEVSGVEAVPTPGVGKPEKQPSETIVVETPKWTYAGRYTTFLEWLEKNPYLSLDKLNGNAVVDIGSSKGYATMSMANKLTGLGVSAKVYAVDSEARAAGEKVISIIDDHRLNGDGLKIQEPIMLMTLFNVTRHYAPPQIRPMLEEAAVKLAEGGLLVVGNGGTPDRGRPLQFIVFQKTGGKLVPRELVAKGSFSGYSLLSGSVPSEGEYYLDPSDAERLGPFFNRLEGVFDGMRVMSEAKRAPREIALEIRQARLRKMGVKFRTLRDGSMALPLEQGAVKRAYRQDTRGRVPGRIAAWTQESEVSVTAVTLDLHDEVLGHLRERFRREGAPLPVLVNFDAHTDMQPYFFNVHEGNWGSKALREGLIDYFVHIPPAEPVLRSTNIRVWRLRKVGWWHRPVIVELKGKELEQFGEENFGNEALVTVDADAYSLEEKPPLWIGMNTAKELGTLGYHTEAGNFKEQSAPLMDFLTKYDFRPDPTVYLSRSPDWTDEKTRTGEAASDGYFMFLEDNLTKIISSSINWEKAERVAIAVRSMKHGEQILDFSNPTTMACSLLSYVADSYQERGYGKSEELNRRIDELFFSENIAKNGRGLIGVFFEGAVIDQWGETLKKIKEHMAGVKSLMDGSEGKEKECLTNALKDMDLAIARLQSRIEILNGTVPQTLISLRQLREIMPERDPQGRGVGSIVEVRGVKKLLAAKVVGNPLSLSSVFYNQVVNGRKSWEEKTGAKGSAPKITMTLSRDKKVSRDDRMKYVVIEVADNGKGLSAKQLAVNPKTRRQRIFDLNNSTRGYDEKGKVKKEEAGTGLGTTEAWRVVTDMGGTIVAVNILDDEGKIIGAKFIIRLPLAESVPGRSEMRTDAGRSQVSDREKFERGEIAWRSLDHGGVLLNVMGLASSAGACLTMVSELYRERSVKRNERLDENIVKLDDIFKKLFRDNVSKNNRGLFGFFYDGTTIDRWEETLNKVKEQRQRVRSLMVGSDVEEKEKLQETLKEMDLAIVRLQSRIEIVNGAAPQTPINMKEVLRILPDRDPKGKGIKAIVEVRREEKDLLAEFAGNPLSVAVVFYDLIVNGRKSWEEKADKDRAPKITMTLGRDAATKELVIEIADNGKGLSDEQLTMNEETGRQRVFDLNNSTRSDKETKEDAGTGLGTTEVWRVITDMGGTIDADNVRDDKGNILGARFIMRLPLLPEANAPATGVLGAETRSETRTDNEQSQTADAEEMPRMIALHTVTQAAFANLKVNDETDRWLTLYSEYKYCSPEAKEEIAQGLAKELIKTHGSGIIGNKEWMLVTQQAKGFRTPMSYVVDRLAGILDISHTIYKTEKARAAVSNAGAYSAKDYEGRMKVLADEPLVGEKDALLGKNVIFVDDAYNTGATALKRIRQLREFGPHNVYWSFILKLDLKDPGNEALINDWLLHREKYDTMTKILDETLATGDLDINRKALTLLEQKSDIFKEILKRLKPESRGNFLLLAEEVNMEAYRENSELLRQYAGRRTGKQRSEMREVSSEFREKVVDPIGRKLAEKKTEGQNYQVLVLTGAAGSGKTTIEESLKGVGVGEYPSAAIAFVDTDRYLNAGGRRATPQIDRESFVRQLDMFLKEGKRLVIVSGAFAPDFLKDTEYSPASVRVLLKVPLGIARSRTLVRDGGLWRYLSTYPLFLNDDRSYDLVLNDIPVFSPPLVRGEGSFFSIVDPAIYGKRVSEQSYKVATSDADRIIELLHREGTDRGLEITDEPGSNELSDVERLIRGTVSTLTDMEDAGNDAVIMTVRSFEKGLEVVLEAERDGGAGARLKRFFKDSMGDIPERFFADQAGWVAQTLGQQPSPSPVPEGHLLAALGFPSKELKQKRFVNSEGVFSSAPRSEMREVNPEFREKVVVAIGDILAKKKTKGQSYQILALLGAAGNGKTRIGQLLKSEGVGEYGPDDIAVVDTDDYLPEYLGKTPQIPQSLRDSFVKDLDDALFSKGNRLVIVSGVYAPLFLKRTIYEGESVNVLLDVPPEIARLRVLVRDGGVFNHIDSYGMFRQKGSYDLVLTDIPSFSSPLVPVAGTSISFVSPAIYGKKTREESYRVSVEDVNRIIDLLYREGKRSGLKVAIDPFKDELSDVERLVLAIKVTLIMMRDKGINSVVMTVRTFEGRKSGGLEVVLDGQGANPGARWGESLKFSQKDIPERFFEDSEGWAARTIDRLPAPSQLPAGHWVAAFGFPSKTLERNRFKISNGIFPRSEARVTATALGPSVGEIPRAELRNVLKPGIAEDLKGIRLGYDFDAVKRAELRKLSVPTTITTLAGMEFDPGINSANFMTMITEIAGSIVRTPVALASEQFKAQDSVMPAGDQPGLVIDILGALPTPAKWQAIEAILKLNKNQHYGMIVLATPDKTFLDRISSMSPDIKTRIHFKALGAESPAHVLRNNIQKMFGEVQRAQAFKGTGELFVVTGTQAVCTKLEDGLNAAVVETEGIDEEVLDTAGTVVTADLSQKLLQGAALSEKTSKAIQKVGRRYRLIAEGLKALLSKLTTEIQGLLSLGKSA